MSRLRRDLALILPGGLVVLAAMALLRPGVTPDSIGPYIHVGAALVLTLGVCLGWYHNRSRIVFAFGLLALADGTLWWLARHGELGGGTGHTVVGALAVLLPLNLAAYSTLADGASPSTGALRRLVPIAAQVAVVGLMVRWGTPTLATWLDRRWFDGDWSHWTAVPELGIVAFTGAVVFVALRYVLLRDPLAAGFLWTLISAFLALHGLSRGWDPTAFFTTGGWVLIGSLVEAGYRWATHDEVTELPERDTLNGVLRRVGRPHFLALVGVDHLKRIKDLFGRDVADQALRMVAAQLRQVPGAVAFRYGRDRFAVLFDSVPAEEAIPHLEEVRRVIASYAFVVRSPKRPRAKPASPRPATGPRVVVTVTVSIGAAEPETPEARPRHVIRAASQALRHAIETGRNQVIA